MTPQPEYIITDIQVKRILILMNRDSVMDLDEFKEIAEELRSRPAPSSEEVNPWCYPGCILIDRAKKEAAAQAREDCIEDYTRELKQNIIKSDLSSNCFDRLSMIIHDTTVSLRSHTGGGE